MLAVVPGLVQTDIGGTTEGWRAGEVAWAICGSHLPPALSVVIMLVVYKESRLGYYYSDPAHAMLAKIVVCLLPSFHQVTFRRTIVHLQTEELGGEHNSWSKIESITPILCHAFKSFRYEQLARIGITFVG